MPGNKKLFLFAVSREFLACRELLTRDLKRPTLEVAVQAGPPPPRSHHPRVATSSPRPRTGPESAKADLDEAWEIAERGPMPLFLTDIHLYRARLFFRETPYLWQSPQHDLAEARRLILGTAEPDRR